MSSSQREIGGYMAVIQGAITDYQAATHVTGSIGRDTGGLVSSTHIATFQINGQTVQLKGDAPAGLVNGDVIRVTGQRNSSGIFEVLYYFNITRKCHSPPPKVGFSRFLSKAFIGVGAVIFLGCLGVAWIIYAETKSADIWELLSSIAPAAVLAAFLFEGGRRSLN